MRIILSFIFIIYSCTYAQSFGQNKVQYKDFDWNYIQTSHFDIYYYDDQQDLAEFVADVAEESYEQISIHLRWNLKIAYPLWSIILTTNFNRLMW